jgi:hypothetical protein
VWVDCSNWGTVKGEVVVEFRLSCVGGLHVRVERLATPNVMVNYILYEAELFN